MAVSASVLRDTFAKLQPVCVELAQHQSIAGLTKLKDCLSTLSREALSDLHEYILFPLRLILKQQGTKSEGLCIMCLSCLHEVLSACRAAVSNLGLYQDLFSTLFCLISAPPTGSDGVLTVAPVCEEIKLLAVQCVTALIGAAASSVIVQFYCSDFLPLLGHAVTVLLELARRESMRGLRTAALNCLVFIACCDRSDVSRACGDIFAAFLPGIISALAAVVTGDSKQGNTVTCGAISAFRQIVCLVMADSALAVRCCDSMPAEENKKKSCSTAVSKSKYSSLVVERSKEWVESTSKKLQLVVDKVIVVATDSHWRVRLSMVELAESLLTRCTRSLQCCVLVLIDVLVRATTDQQNMTVATRARQALDQFSNLSLDKDSRPVIEILEENVFCLAGRLPTCLSSSDDAQKLASIRLLRGYIQLLGSKIDVVLQSSVHLHRLSAALLDILEFDCSIIHIIEERSTATSFTMIREAEAIERSPYHFKCFFDSAIECEIVTICRLLGYYGNMLILTDHFLELFALSAAYRKQAAYCLKEIVNGLRSPPECAGCSLSKHSYDADELDTCVRSFLEEYVQPKYWNLPVTGHVDKQSESLACTGLQIISHEASLQSLLNKTSRSIEQINSNILLLCLMLNGIEQCGLLLGTEFQIFLIDTLYALLEKVGSENARVSRCALLCLRSIAKACGSETVAALLRDNSDYLVNSISLKLRHIRKYPEAPSVLQVALRCGDVTILPLINDLIFEILNTLDEHHDERATSFMNVLCSLAVVIASNNVEHEEVDLVGSGKPCSVPRPEEVRRYFVDYKCQKEIASRFDDDDCATEGANNDDVEDDADNSEKNEHNALPDHIQLVIEIMKRCQHLLMSADARLRLTVLETIAQCCLAMRFYKDDLLPLVHCVWKPFVHRFNDAEPVVAMKAFETFRTLAVTCGDFVHRRFVEDVVPKMITSLHKLAQTSVKGGPSYHFTQACKLQQCMLKTLGPLCAHSQVEGIPLCEFMHACLPYLSARQPACLQTACVETFRHFIDIDPDNVWLLLNDVYCPQSPLTSTVQDLPAIQMAGSKERNEFTDNIVQLIAALTGNKR